MSKVPPYDRPRLFASIEYVRQRRNELTQAHIQPLTDFAESLRKAGCYGAVPDFDPWDAGVEAQALFLFEKPGRKAFKSGFISRNNNDQTAANTFELMKRANVCRKRTCTWNVIPGWNETTDLTAEEREKGIQALPKLFDHLGSLKVIVLVGNEAKQLWGRLPNPPSLPLIDTAHPSPQVRNTRRLLWDDIAVKWSQVNDHIEAGCECGNC